MGGKGGGGPVLSVGRGEEEMKGRRVYKGHDSV